jgi:hypothetical protein
MSTVLITQCLQRDFVDPIGPHDPLPNLLHVGYSEAARLLGPDLADFNNLADPYDYKLAEIATDPSVVQFDKARRVHAGQTSRRLKRRLNAGKHYDRIEPNPPRPAGYAS